MLFDEYFLSYKNVTKAFLAFDSNQTEKGFFGVETFLRHYNFYHTLLLLTDLREMSHNNITYNQSYNIYVKLTLSQMLEIFGDDQKLILW